MKTIIPLRAVCVNLHGGVTHNRQNGTNQTSLNRYVDKWPVVRSHDGKLPGNEKEQTIGPLDSVDERQKQNAKWQGPQSQAYVLTTPALRNPGKDRTIRTELGGRWPGAGREGRGCLRRDAREFWGAAETSRIFTVVAATWPCAAVPTYPLERWVLLNGHFYFNFKILL